MVLEIALILTGVPLGFALRKQKKIVNYTNIILPIVIYIMLFLIGISLGSNDNLIESIAKLGVQGITIGVCSALGGAVVLSLCFRKFFNSIPQKKTTTKHNNADE